MKNARGSISQKRGPSPSSRRAAAPVGLSVLPSWEGLIFRGVRLPSLGRTSCHDLGERTMFPLVLSVPGSCALAVTSANSSHCWNDFDPKAQPYLDRSATCRSRKRLKQLACDDSTGRFHCHCIRIHLYACKSSGSGPQPKTGPATPRKSSCRRRHEAKPADVFAQLRQINTLCLRQQRMKLGQAMQKSVKILQSSICWFMLSEKSFYTPGKHATRAAEAVAGGGKSSGSGPVAVAAAALCSDCPR